MVPVEAGRYKRLVSRLSSDHCAARYQAETTESPDLMPLPPAGEGEPLAAIEIGRFLGLGPAQPGPPPIALPE